VGLRRHSCLWSGSREVLALQLRGASFATTIAYILGCSMQRALLACSCFLQDPVDKSATARLCPPAEFSMSDITKKSSGGSSQGGDSAGAPPPPQDGHYHFSQAEESAEAVGSEEDASWTSLEEGQAVQPPKAAAGQAQQGARHLVSLVSVACPLLPSCPGNQRCPAG
jgi:hypothetical protein